MLKSMTGYGRAEAAWSGGRVAVEVRAVNHRFCEVVTRLPKPLSMLEDELKRAVQGRCQRGRIELSVTLSGVAEGTKTLSLDRPLAKQYYLFLRSLQRELRLAGNIDVALLAGFRDILTVSDQPVVSPRLHPIVRRLAAKALTSLDGMRRREGQALTRDTKIRLGLIRKETRAIGARAPQAVQEHFDRMAARVEKLAGAIPLDQHRLTQELAQYADRGDIAEELTRLASHLDQFEAGFGSREPMGRTLDFLLQEMGREINTIGSKANDADIASRVVRVKSELEKIREQVQNIE